MSIEQLHIFSCFLFTGFLIGILFDIFRILRKSFRTSDILTYIQDFIFWILTGLILLYSIFTFNNGELRGYIFISIILGVILYFLTLSKYVIFIFTKIIAIIIYPFKIIWKFLNKYIFSYLFKILKDIHLKICKISIKNIKKDKFLKKT